MVTDGFSLGLVWFLETSLVAVALLCYAGGIIIYLGCFIFGFGIRGCASL